MNGHRLLSGWIGLLLWGAAIGIAQPDDPFGPPGKPVSPDPFEMEIARLNDLKIQLSVLAKEEPDGKKRNRIEEMVLLSNEVINWMQMERNETHPQKKKEYARLLEETRTRLDENVEALRKEKEAENNPPPPPPTPTPGPDTYTTENGFKVRLRMPD